MAGGGSKSTIAPRARKRVEAETSDSTTTAATSTLKRAKDGSAFARCEECNKTVAVALISMHSCSLEAKIQMNLDAQVVEAPTEIKKKTETKPRKKPAAKDLSAKKGKKDPSKPKRPPTAFFVFMEEFRKTFMEENPDCKKVSVVAKEGGEKWKSLTDEEKKVYIDIAAERKAEYAKTLESEKNDAEDVVSSNEEEDESLEKESKVETLEVDEE